MKTTITYSESIRHHYLRAKESGKLRGEIYKLTPAHIRKLCLNLILEDLAHTDKIIMKNFFEIKSFDDISAKIKTYDIDGFRPICKFLKKENKSIASHEALELIALIIDFHPRPFRCYKDETLSAETALPNEDLIVKDKNVTYFSNSDKGKSDVVVKTKQIKLFAWFSNASAFNKLLIFGSGFLFFTSMLLTVNNVLNNKVKWMVWQDDHYIEVNFDTKKYDLNQLKYYKEDRIKKFKKIRPTCEYPFFN
jgi:hypothetical protein